VLNWYYLKHKLHFTTLIRFYTKSFAAQYARVNVLFRAFGTGPLGLHYYGGAVGRWVSGNICINLKSSVVYW